jgi:hypothetical protein
MNFLDNSLLTVLLTLAATFLGLSIVVQVVQELYKYLRSSKGRAYQIALQDFLGPLAQELLRPGVLPDVRVRGPMQLKRVRSKGMILPFKKEELANALERTAPPWIQRTLKQLNLEVDFQTNKPLSKSVSWGEYLKELGKVEQGTTGYWNAVEIVEFLKEWEYTWHQETVDDNQEIKRIGTINPKNTEVDAKQLLLAFRKRFLPYVENANENFSQLGNNFEYTYGRANSRLTFIIALLLTFIFNLPINVLYRNAQQVDSESAIKFAETTLDIYSNQKDSLLTKEDIELAKNIMRNTLELQKDKQNTKHFIDFSTIPNPFSGDYKFFLYLLYCFITAIFITFGAPFWNDIASALLRLQKGKSSVKNSSAPEVNNG